MFAFRRSAPPLEYRSFGHALVESTLMPSGPNQTCAVGLSRQQSLAFFHANNLQDCVAHGMLRGAAKISCPSGGVMKIGSMMITKRADREHKPKAF